MNTPVAPPPIPRIRTRKPVDDDLIATWFPRVGAVALVVGAAFGYKLAVDRGLIGPLGRVALGLATGVAMVLASEWTRRRRWDGFSQAIGGGGIGLLTLVAWAAYRRYGIISAGPEFALLTGITAAGGWLAFSHDSEALAILVTITGFMTPVIIGTEPSRGTVFAYVLIFDGVVVTLATMKRWTSLPWLAAAGSWTLFALSFGEVTHRDSFIYETFIFALFTVTSFVAGFFTRRTSDPATVALAFANAFVYHASVLSLVAPPGHGSRAIFGATMGAAFCLFALASHRTGDERLSKAQTIVGVILATIAVPEGVTGVYVGVVWTVEAMLLLVAGDRMRSALIRSTGLVVLAIAFVTQIAGEFTFGATYHPAHIAVSVESLAMGLLMAAMFVAAEVTPEPDLSMVFGVAGELLGLTWLSFEAHAALLPRLGTVDGQHGLAFAYSVAWASYAAGLMTFGVLARHRGTRIVAVAIFALTIAKMVTHDLWLLSTVDRTVGFIGLGVLLLACSLLYNRFRELIVGPGEERTHEPSATLGSSV